jgi:hypothetical protein
MLPKRYILFLVIAIFYNFQNCTPNDREVTRAFYFWKTSFNLSHDDIEYINSLDINKIYLRLFDVVWNDRSGMAEPLAAVRLKNGQLQKEKLVPTIFITNNTINQISKEDIGQLGANIERKIKSYFEQKSAEDFKEVQIDCDWTEKTKDKYFALLKKIKDLIGEKTLSATIRLHQIKYFKQTGVPPVDRGMLMFYNMSSVSSIDTKNSIYDEDVAKKYLVNFDNYPLQLDVALPAFSWVVLFQNRKITSLITDINTDELDDKNKFKALSENQFTPVNDHFFHGEYVVPNDILRTEVTTPEITLSAAKLINRYLENNNITVSIYHYNKELQNEYSKKDLENIFTAFN